MRGFSSSLSCLIIVCVWGNWSLLRPKVYSLLYIKAKCHRELDSLVVFAQGSFRDLGKLFQCYSWAKLCNFVGPVFMDWYSDKIWIEWSGDWVASKLIGTEELLNKNWAKVNYDAKTTSAMQINAADPNRANSRFSTFRKEWKSRKFLWFRYL